MKKKIKYILFFSVVIAFFSCTKEQQPPVYMGYDYFPAKVGHYVIYECDSIVHNIYGNNTYSYQIKELIDSIYSNNQGQPTMRIVRYKRTDTTEPWSNILISEKVWTGNLLSNMAIRQEDNEVYVKLIFPMTLNETWNGNSFNTIGTWNYQYTALNTPYTLTNYNRSVHFDSTLTVLQHNSANLLNYDYFYEQYATGIGLIKKVVNYDSTMVFGTTIPPDTSLSTTYGVWYTETYLTSGSQ